MADHKALAEETSFNLKHYKTGLLLNYKAKCASVLFKKSSPDAHFTHFTFHVAITCSCILKIF